MRRSPSPAPRPPTGLAGRDAESALLRRALENLGGRAGRTVLVEGEAGIGKSALLDDVLSDPAAGDYLVLRGGCDALTQRFPLWAMMQALGLSKLPTAEAATAEAATAAAATSGLPADPAMGALERLVSWVHRLCADRPVVLVLEDLHWADEASLLCWQRLSQLTDRIPLLLIGTRRPLPANATIERVRRDVHRHRGLIISLAELAPEAVTELARGLLQASPGTALLARLATAAGNPFYIRELIEALVREGVVGVADGVADLPDFADVADLAGRSDETQCATATTASLRESIISRIDFLSADAVGMLRIAALLGPEFSVSDLAMVTGTTAAALVAVVDDAMTAGLLAPSGSRLKFRSELVRHALQDSMPDALREGLHRQAAYSLFTARAPAERVARHLLMTTLSAESWEVDWLVGEGAALARAVPAVAADFLERTARLLPRDDARRGAFEDQLTDTLFVLGRYGEVEQISREILETTTDPERRGKAAWLLGYALSRARRGAEAVAFLREAAAWPDLTPTWRARIAAIRTMLRNSTDDGEQVDQALADVLAEGRRLGDATTTAYALHAQSIRKVRGDDLAGALRSIEQALPLAAEHRMLADLHMLLLANRHGITVELGRLREAAALTRRALARNELSGSPRLGTLRLEAGLTAYELGDWDEATEQLAALGGIEHNRQDELLALRALIAGHRDDWARAARYLAALREVTDAYGVEPDRPASHHGGLVLAAWALKAEHAGTTWKGPRLQDLWRRLGTGNREQARYKILPTVVRLALGDGDRSTADAAAEAALREADTSGLERARTIWQWCNGLVHGDPDDVLAAAGAMRDMGLTLDPAHALEDAAVLLAEADDLASARERLNEAVAIYTRLGASWDARRAGARLRPLGIRPGARGPRDRPATGWAALTKTQRRVAELAATGRPNAEIAAQLFISRRTVESHVSTILGKLQVASRWEIKPPPG